VKIYKNVGGVFAVSLCIAGNKKIFQISDFYFQLPSVLVETMPPHSRRFPGYFAELIAKEKKEVDRHITRVTSQE
jgi:hypothetical protein